MHLRAVHLALLKKDGGGLEPNAGLDALEGIQDVFVPGILSMPKLVAQEAAAARSSGCSPDPCASVSGTLAHREPQGTAGHPGSRVPPLPSARREGGPGVWECGAAAANTGVRSSGWGPHLTFR